MSSERENREWLNNYPLLKQVNSNNPFIVPDGYFNEVEQHILSVIKLNGDASEGFTVPENYFEELSTNINARIIIENNLNKEATGLTVPESYFDDLSNQIKTRIKVQENLNEPTELFAVPDNYFGQLTENILNKTAQLQKTETTKVVKQKGIIRQLFSSPVLKYATAACLTLAVGGTLLLSQLHNNVVEEHNNSFLHKSLLAIPVDEIKSYLQQNVDPTDTHTLIDDSKQVNTDNLTNDLQDELDTSR